MSTRHAFNLSNFRMPNAKDQPDHGIKYLRAGAVANTLCHGLGCIQLLGLFIHCWLHLDVEDWRNFHTFLLGISIDN
ncbi:MAG: hypothetical protein ACK5PQ_00075 [Alphaproteobacteria bacterium]